MGLTVQEFVREKASDLELEVVAGQAGLDRTIAVWELNRPGLALGGFFENFRWDRIQVIGRGEYACLVHVGLKQSPDAVGEFFVQDSLHDPDAPHESHSRTARTGQPVSSSCW